VNAFVLLRLTLEFMLPGGHNPESMPAGMCSLSAYPAFSIARTQNLVAGASVILRATVTGSERAGAGDRFPGAARVVFAVDEVLRGEGVGDTLRIPGIILDQDAVTPDPRDPIPHFEFIRRMSGSCRATTYRMGSQYLLLLRPRAEYDGSLDPYWATLAPTNDEISGPADRWLGWVREEMGRNRGRLTGAAG
jgi:hypothetical protein